MRRSRADERGSSSVPALAVLVVLGAVAVVGVLGDRKPDVDLSTLTSSTTHHPVTG